MAHDEARMRAVSVRLRHVVAGRSVRRLLVLAGLVVAGWLIGCLTQSAHADELPSVPDSGLVTRLDQITRDAPVPAIAPRPEPEAVRAPLRVVPHPPRAQAPETVRTVTADAPAVRRKAAQRPVRARDRHIEIENRTEAGRQRPATAQVPEPVRHHGHDTPAPLPAPASDGSSSAVTLAPFGGPIGLPDDQPWALRRPRASSVRLVGVQAPAVRTAADEPSFAPD
ncbi:hypothetical protein [Spirillospora albida]|uniref:hypothetical protein n=1 Tax=Spirillospora albida TaxID=58123 RepID=UPI0004C2A366|nr:hypothetical protein [Spirillospora albida]